MTFATFHNEIPNNKLLLHHRYCAACTTKGPFIATQLNSIRRRVDLNCVAINGPLATCTLQACDVETNSKVTENHNYHSTTMSAGAAVNKYNHISYFCISAALLTTLTKLPISKTDLALLCDLWHNVYWRILRLSVFYWTWINNYCDLRFIRHEWWP